MWFLLLSVTAFAILVIAKYQGQPELWMWTALIGVTPTEAGEFVRDLWGNVVEFFKTVFQGGSATS